MKTFLGVIIPVIIFLSFPLSVSAQVVINEVLPNPSGSSSEPTEFIELFNTSSDPVIITGWKISDTAGSVKTYTIPDTTLNSGEYASFRREVTDIALNNDGDGVELKDAGNNPKDSMTFGSTIEDRSWSRIPNGTGSFVNNTEPTERLANIEPPTPSPSPTQVATSSPTQSSTQSPTPSPTQSPTPVPTKSPTPRPTKSPSPSPEVLGEETTPTPIATDEVSPTPLVSDSTKKKFPIIPVIFIGSGLVMIGFAAVQLMNAKKSAQET